MRLTESAKLCPFRANSPQPSHRRGKARSSRETSTFKRRTEIPERQYSNKKFRRWSVTEQHPPSFENDAQTWEIVDRQKNGTNEYSYLLRTTGFSVPQGTIVGISLFDYKHSFSRGKYDEKTHALVSSFFFSSFRFLSPASKIPISCRLKIKVLFIYLEYYKMKRNNKGTW